MSLVLIRNMNTFSFVTTMCKYMLRDNGNKVGATPWQKKPCMYYKHIALQHKFMAGKVLFLLQGLPGVEICRERPDVQTACPITGHRVALSPSLPLISIPRPHFGQCHMHRHIDTQECPVTARTVVPREVFCMLSILGVRSTCSAANYK